MRNLFRLQHDMATGVCACVRARRILNGLPIIKYTAFVRASVRDIEIMIRKMLSKAIK